MRRCPILEVWKYQIARTEYPVKDRITVVTEKKTQPQYALGIAKLNADARWLSEKIVTEIVKSMLMSITTAQTTWATPRPTSWLRMPEEGLWVEA